MRLISFFETQEQVLAKTKFVTRRTGWKLAKSGLFLQGVKKSQGRKPGEPVQNLHVIEVVGARLEPLDLLEKDPEYGAREMILEGFPGRDPADFVAWFCDFNMWRPDWPVNRIEFKYPEEYTFTERLPGRIHPITIEGKIS